MGKKEEAKQPTEQEILEARVDAMMAPERPDQPVAKLPEKTKDSAALPPLDIFSDPKTAPEVPKDLLKHLEVNKASSSDSNTRAPSPAPTALTLDDPATEAAVDAIEAQEASNPVEAETIEPDNEDAATEPKSRKIHHHPIFWSFVFIVALVAVLLAYLLVTGGNVHLPAVLQQWVDKLQS